ncbi:MAG: hypothetical protein ACTSRA_11740 [Promethearchaeota archaeon]
MVFKIRKQLGHHEIVGERGETKQEASQFVFYDVRSQVPANTPPLGAGKQVVIIHDREIIQVEDVKKHSF